MLERCVDMEELARLGDSVFDEHTLRIAGHQFDRTEFAMVGQQDSRLLVSQFHHRELAEFALVAGEGSRGSLGLWDCDKCGSAPAN
jgi:hypothetical protein